MAHISFSELAKWDFCPYARKLIYEDKVKKFKGNIFTGFGSAIHSVCEKYFESNRELDKKFFFGEMFRKELKRLERTGEQFTVKQITDFYNQGLAIVEELDQAFDDYFGNDFEFIKAEDTLMERIGDFTVADYKFKGYIDLIIKTKDGKYHIIDYKSCSWGWDAKKRSDRMVTYQLTLYKNYWAQKMGIPHNMIETHFALLKRTAKVGKKVEVFRVTSGPRKTTNALNLLKKALYNVNKQNHLKNRLSCQRCEFSNTQHCT